MALWPRYVRDEFQSMQPLFRFMDDYANHILSGSGRELSAATSNFARFQPKVDVRETENSYEVHAELPGLEQKDVNIEFTDPQTLVIKGATQHVREEGERPTGFIEGSAEQGKLTEGSHKGKKATVEDENAAANGNESTAVTQQSEQPEEPKSRYWVREMSRGEFSRTFSFPSRVDHDAVKASLKNGILSVVVPKAAAPQTKRINIE